MDKHEYTVTIKVPAAFEAGPGVTITPFERARLVALKQAGYHVDTSVTTLTSADRKYNSKVLRSHLDLDAKTKERTYRFKILRAGA